MPEGRLHLFFQLIRDLFQLKIANNPVLSKDWGILWLRRWFEQEWVLVLSLRSYLLLLLPFEVLSFSLTVFEKLHKILFFLIKFLLLFQLLVHLFKFFESIVWLDLLFNIEVNFIVWVYWALLCLVFLPTLESFLPHCFNWVQNSLIFFSESLPYFEPAHLLKHGQSLTIFFLQFLLHYFLSNRLLLHRSILGSSLFESQGQLFFRLLLLKLNFKCLSLNLFFDFLLLLRLLNTRRYKAYWPLGLLNFFICLWLRPKSQSSFLLNRFCFLNLLFLVVVIVIYFLPVMLWVLLRWGFRALHAPTAWA